MEFIQPNWPAPSHIKAITTLRSGGVSQAPYQSFNLAAHVGDSPVSVTKNRQLLQQHWRYPGEITWLNQVHGNRVVNLDKKSSNHDADGSYSAKAQQVCAVMTADCLPVLLCNQAGTEVAAIHGGWRSLASGIIQVALNHLHSPASELLAWLGPAIGPQAFAVGSEVQTLFCQPNPALHSAFTQYDDILCANLYQIATLQLQQGGVKEIYGGDHCTFTESKRFFSFRRDGDTGRMITAIYISDDSG